MIGMDLNAALGTWVITHVVAPAAVLLVVLCVIAELAE